MVGSPGLWFRGRYTGVFAPALSAVRSSRWMGPSGWDATRMSLSKTPAAAGIVRQASTGDSRYSSRVAVPAATTVPARAKESRPCW